MAKRFQQGFRRRTSHSKIKTYDESHCEDAIGRVVFNFIEPGEKRYYGKQDPWKSVVADDRSGQPDKLSSTDYSKLDYDRAWSSQEWKSEGKSEVTAHDRSRQSDKTSWSMVQQVRPHHGETLLDGAAQSVRYGGIISDRSGQPDNVNSKEVADSTNFVMGSDAAEFVNKVNDQVRKRQKRMSNVAGSGEEHSIIWRMLTMNVATFMGKNFPGQSKFPFHYEYNRSHLEENVRHICKLVGEQDEIFNADKTHRENTHGNICH